MSLPYIVTAPTDSQAVRDVPATRLRGRRLAVARAAWLLVALLALIIFVVATPFFFNQLQSACPTTTCATEQLTAAELRDPGSRLVAPVLRDRAHRGAENDLRIELARKYGANLIQQRKVLSLAPSRREQIAVTVLAFAQCRPLVLKIGGLLPHLIE